MISYCSLDCQYPSSDIENRVSSVDSFRIQNGRLSWNSLKQLWEKWRIRVASLEMLLMYSKIDDDKAVGDAQYWGTESSGICFWDLLLFFNFCLVQRFLQLFILGWKWPDKKVMQNVFLFINEANVIKSGRSRFEGIFVIPFLNISDLSSRVSLFKIMKIFFTG